LSTFNSSPNWMQGLQGLFGGQGGGMPSNAVAGQSRPFDGGHYRVNPRESLRFSPSQGQVNMGRGIDPLGGSYDVQHWMNMGNQGQQGRNPTPGQALMGALGTDYQRTEDARQQELGMYRGLFDQLFGSMRGAGQMVQDARGMAGQNMLGMEQQAGRMREAGAEGDKYFGEARDQMLRGLDEARGRFDASIQTAKDSRAGFDASWMGDAASNRAGLQADYMNRESAIKNNDSLTEEQKGMMLDQLRQDKSMQASQIQASATSKARDTLIAMDQNIAQLQAMAGGTLGQLGVGVGQAIGSLGMQNAAQKQQIETQIGSFYNNMAQFNSQLVNASQSSALQYVINGLQMGAQLINAMPLGPLSVFTPMAQAITAGDLNRNRPMDNTTMGLFQRFA
jgi:hypothetical protein